jgi:pyruvate formate lyase activating enzyme
VPQDNDSDEELSKIANFIANELDADTPWHISAFHPDYKVQNKSHTPLETLQRAYSIGKNAGLKYIYMGNVQNTNTTFCPNCHKALIERKGFRVEKNIINGDSCPYCNEHIAGIWR